MKNKGGRPTKYKPEYCQSLVKFFDIEPYVVADITVTKPDGTKTEKTVFNASDLPFFSDWCAEIGIDQTTMSEWVKVHPEFSLAYKRAKELQEKILVTNGIKDLYAQPFAIFTAKNILGWKDKLEHSGDKESPLTVEVVSYVQNPPTA